LEILLGPDHPTAEAFGLADAAMLDSYRALGAMSAVDPTQVGTRRGERMIDRQEKLVARIEKGRENFRIAKEQFARTAHAAAGAKL
jgi:hypothetical protein